MFQNTHSSFLIYIHLIPSDWKKHPDNWNIGTNWPRSLAIAEERWDNNVFFYLPLEDALSRIGNSCWCIMQKVHVLTIRASLSFTKVLMFLWTIQTVPCTDPEFPLQKYLWWSCRCLRNMWRRKREGGVGCVVSPSSWGCDVHNLSPLQAPQENKCSCQEEMATTDPDYVFSNFGLTTLVRSDTETWTSNSFKPKDGLSRSNLLAPFHLPLIISSLHKTYHLSLEKGILSSKDFTSSGFQKRLFLKSYGSLVAECYETQDTLSLNTGRAIYTRQEHVRGNGKTTTSHPWGSVCS